jgi:UDP-N-acetylmuramoyl-tripeptide--D-alanyl-D-alanine ligase
MQLEKLYEIFLRFPRIQTDTRSLKQGEIFFALKGPNFNGNQFAKTAISMGAAAVVVDEPTDLEGENVFLVNDCLQALQALALHHRKQFNIPFIAITGSNGKTTTKELIHAVLSSTFKTYTTKGNLNNHIGVPLTLLSIQQDAEMAIIEMGANHQKEIESYCTIALPTHGLITNCGKAHLEGFGGVEGIRKGKGELYDYLSGSNGTAFVNSDLDYLESMVDKVPHKIYYGNNKGSFTTSILETESLLGIKVCAPGTSCQRVFSRLVGSYNKANIEAAICIGQYFNIPFDTIRNAIEAYTPDNARSQLIKKGSNTIILDAYNANPSSMQAAIENFAKMDAEKKYLFLGGMMELGEDSKQEHQQLVTLLENLKLENTILVGGDFSHVKHPFQFFADVEKAGNWLKENQPANAHLLIKGSRSIKMEKLLDALQ